jgi:phage terminase small subunit
MRKAGPRDWTKHKEAEFLSVLADTCNVTQAAEEAGVSSSSAYRRRKENAAFRAGWLEAISVAYQRLELVLLDRAFNGTEKVVKRKDGSEERMLEYSNQLGLTLLKMHRDTAVEADAQFQPEEIEEVRKRLLNKLKRLKARRERERASDERA